MKKVISTLFLLCAVAALYAQDVHVVFIGNSITQGALLQNPKSEAPPARACHYLALRLGTDSVAMSNCGVSGMTTLNFVPAAGELFRRVCDAAAGPALRKKTRLVFSISLGTNDSAETTTFGAPVHPVQYYANMKVIIDELLARYPRSKVVIQYPLWYSPTCYNNARYLLSGQKRLESYYPMIEKLAAHYAEACPGRVLTGSTEVWNVFRDHCQEYLTPESGNAGTFYLHPNRRGADVLGKYWADALLKAVR